MRRGRDYGEERRIAELERLEALQRERELPYPTGDKFTPAPTPRVFTDTPPAPPPIRVKRVIIYRQNTALQWLIVVLLIVAIGMAGVILFILGTV